MDLVEELARYIAAQTDGVTDWDKQPGPYQADLRLYAGAAIRFFMDRMPGTTMQADVVVRLGLTGLTPDDPRINDLLRAIDGWEAAHGIEGSSVEVVRPQSN